MDKIIEEIKVEIRDSGHHILVYVYDATLDVSTGCAQRNEQIRWIIKDKNPLIVQLDGSPLTLSHIGPLGNNTCSLQIRVMNIPCIGGRQSALLEYHLIQHIKESNPGLLANTKLTMASQFVKGHSIAGLCIVYIGKAILADKCRLNRKINKKTLQRIKDGMSEYPNQFQTVTLNRTMDDDDESEEDEEDFDENPDQFDPTTLTYDGSWRVAGLSPDGHKIWKLFVVDSKSDLTGRYTLVGDDGVDIELDESCVMELCNEEEISCLSNGQTVFAHNPATNEFELADIVCENAEGGTLGVSNEDGNSWETRLVFQLALKSGE